MSNKLLQTEDYARAADSLDCDVPAIKAVAEVESRGAGFLPDGRLKILFEAHIFSARTKGKYDTVHPNISSKTWNRALYKGGEAEHDRLYEAQQLDPVAAWCSASWGKFQIMGFNYAPCGFKSARDMIDYMHVSEGNQLDCFVAFIKSNPKMHKALQDHDWDVFKTLYNGPGANGYAQKIKNAYDLEVKCGQR